MNYRRVYISKDMHYIWFSFNFEIVLVQDSPIKRKSGEICMDEWKPRNGKDISSIRCG
jgi:hypothetical protein